MLSLQRTEAVRLEESLCERLELPRDFTLEAPPAETKMPKMYALRAASEGGGPEGGRMMVEGVVSRRTSLLPTASLDYRVFAKKRQIQHHRKERRVELLRDDWGPGGEGGRGAGGAVRKMIDLNAPLSGAGVGRGTGEGRAPEGAARSGELADGAFQMLSIEIGLDCAGVGGSTGAARGERQECAERDL